MSKQRLRFGFFSIDIHQRYLSEMLSGIISYSNEKNIDIVIFNTDTDFSSYKYDKQDELVYNTASNFELDGVLYLGWLNNQKKLQLSLNHENKLPIVNLLNKSDEFVSVYQDDEHNMTSLMDHLIKFHNCKKILFIEPIFPDTRIDIYKEKMVEHNLFNENLVVLRSDLITENTLNPIEIANKLENIVFYEKNLEIDAIISAHSDETIKICDMLKKLGKKIPDEISVVTMEESESCKYYQPSISTIYYPFYEIGYTGCKTLYELLNGESVNKENIIQGKFFYRNSCNCTPNNFRISSEIDKFKDNSIFEIDNFSKRSLFQKLNLDLIILPIEELYNTFEKSLELSNIDIFLHWIDDFINNKLYSFEQYELIQEDILLFRKYIMPYLVNDIKLNTLANDIWVEFKILINNIKEKELESKISKQNSISLGLSKEIGIDLITCFNLHKIKEILDSKIKKLNIQNCFIYRLVELENNTFFPILFYRSDNKLRAPVNIVQNSYYDLDDFFSGEKRHTYLFNILNVRNNLVGCAFFEYSELYDYFYSNLAVELSSAIRGATVLEELKFANDEIRAQISIITETQHQLIQSEKMALLGNLVAGVAHEINTPIGVALTATSHILKSTNEMYGNLSQNKITKSSFIQYINDSLDTIKLMNLNLEKASNLIKGFKRLSSDMSSEEKRLFNLKGCFDDVMISLGLNIRKYKHNVEIDCPNDIVIFSYPGMISQILTNFIMNSIIHAYDDGVIGNLNITATKEKNHITLIYSDDGKGISKENLARIYEPFFTTNKHGGGTGLGLNIIYNIVNQSLNGTIKCSSQIGIGTTFVVEFNIDEN